MWQISSSSSVQKGSRRGWLTIDHVSYYPFASSWSSLFLGLSQSVTAFFFVRWSNFFIGLDFVVVALDILFALLLFLVPLCCCTSTDLHCHTTHSATAFRIVSMKIFMVITSPEWTNIDLFKAIKIKLTFERAQTRMTKVQWNNLLEERVFSSSSRSSNWLQRRRQRVTETKSVRQLIEGQHNKCSNTVSLCIYRKHTWLVNSKSSSAVDEWDDIPTATLFYFR